VLLSVVLPNFNHGHLIGHALDALAAQERLADEIIVVDDASTDDSLAILERYRERLPQMIVLRSEHNTGAIGALQRGLASASGRYVYFAAGDDWVLPRFFEKALAILDANPDCGLVCGEAKLLSGETGKLLGYRPAVRPRARAGKISPERARQLLARADNFILTGSTVFRRDVVVEKGGLDERAGSFADGLLARKIALTHGFYFEPGIFVVWNVFLHGLSRTTSLDIVQARKAIHDLPALIERDVDFPSWYSATLRRRLRFGTARLALEADPPRLAVLLEIGATSTFDKWLLSILAPWVRFRLARWLALAYLTTRLRPYRLSDLIVTAFARRKMLLVAKARRAICVDGSKRLPHGSH
jgi:glycosyltransferase involved in cell wall biosynthesis